MIYDAGLNKVLHDKRVFDCNHKTDVQKICCANLVFKTVDIGGLSVYEYESYQNLISF